MKSGNEEKANNLQEKAKKTRQLESKLKNGERDALRQLETEANNNNPYASDLLAQFYYYGNEYVKANYGNAEKYARKTLEQLPNEELSQQVLKEIQDKKEKATRLCSTREYSPDLCKSSLEEECTKNKNPYAAHDLADILLGEGNYKDAHWYAKIAEEHDITEALIILALIAEKEEDVYAAYRYYQTAGVLLNDPVALLHLGRLIWNPVTHTDTRVDYGVTAFQAAEYIYQAGKANADDTLAFCVIQAVNQYNIYALLVLMRLNAIVELIKNENTLKPLVENFVSTPEEEKDSSLVQQEKSKVKYYILGYSFEIGLFGYKTNLINACQFYKKAADLGFEAAGLKATEIQEKLQKSDQIKPQKQ